MALLGILALTTSLVSRTFEVRLSRRPSVSTTAEKAKIQHRDKKGARWSPSTASTQPFYLLVVDDAVEPEQKPLLSAHVDDCLYNRPPPRS